jgi:tripartite-type tricarboxylate transporter receptor subunit TctC
MNGVARMDRRRVIRRGAAVVACLLLMQVTASAQNWPSRPTPASIPFGTGSAAEPD